MPRHWFARTLQHGPDLLHERHPPDVNTQPVHTELLPVRRTQNGRLRKGVMCELRAR